MFESGFPGRFSDQNLCNSHNRVTSLKKKTNIKKSKIYFHSFLKCYKLSQKKLGERSDNFKIDFNPQLAFFPEENRYNSPVKTITILILKGL